MCTCVDPDAIRCTASRHDATLTLIVVLDAACRCCCHKAANGTPVVHDQWHPLSEHKPVVQKVAMKKDIPYGKPRQGHSKLTPDDVIEIRRLAATYTRYQLAERYGVSHTTISDIVNGLNWRSVESEEQPA